MTVYFFIHFLIFLPKKAFSSNKTFFSPHFLSIADKTPQKIIKKYAILHIYKSENISYNIRW